MSRGEDTGCVQPGEQGCGLDTEPGSGGDLLPEERTTETIHFKFDFRYLRNERCVVIKLVQYGAPGMPGVPAASHVGWGGGQGGGLAGGGAAPLGGTLRGHRRWSVTFIHARDLTENIK